MIIGVLCLMGALSAFAERKPNIIYIFTGDPEYAPVLAKMKAAFDRWFPNEGSPVFNKTKRNRRAKKPTGSAGRTEEKAEVGI